MRHGRHPVPTHDTPTAPGTSARRDSRRSPRRRLPPLREHGGPSARAHRLRRKRRARGVHRSGRGARRDRTLCCAVESDLPPLRQDPRDAQCAHDARGDTDFEIVESHAGGTGARSSPPTRPPVTTACASLRSSDRRYRYPFLNCTNCGPRFTIVRDVPYDRSRDDHGRLRDVHRVSREYHDPGDRRFHAQPTCCPTCGPRLRFQTTNGDEPAGDPIGCAAAALRARARSWP